MWKGHLKGGFSVDTFSSSIVETQRESRRLRAFRYVLADFLSAFFFCGCRTMRKIFLGITVFLLTYTIPCHGEIVIFPDVNLENVIRQELNIPAPTPITSDDMLQLTDLNARYKNITNLSGLEYAENLLFADLRNNQLSSVLGLPTSQNLTVLYLRSNQIADLVGFPDLPNLETLQLSDNQLSNVSGLPALQNLTYLGLGFNQIADLTDFPDYPNLQTLFLDRNLISDISVLAGLTGLSYLYLNGNPLNDDAFNIYLPQIQFNNPS